MTNYKEEYIVRWFLPGGRLWTTGHISNTYDKALKVINRYKHTDKNIGKKYKYRITKQTIQEEVVYDD
jgi:hypothetical protein